MKLKVICVLSAALLAAACSEEERVSDSRARVYYKADTLITMKSVYATLDDGSSVWNFKPHNFFPLSDDLDRFASPEVQTGSEGTLRMTFHLDDTTGTTFSSGSISAPLSSNWRWQFELVHGDSLLACIDCVTTRRFNITAPGHANEWIYVLWRGRGP
jgi:hypothetical protein